MNNPRFIAAAATLGTLFLLFAGPSSRAQEAGKLQDRLRAEAIVLDPILNPARLNSAARRLPRRAVSFETRVEQGTTIITRFPETFAEQR